MTSKYSGSAVQRGTVMIWGQSIGFQALYTLSTWFATPAKVYQKYVMTHSAEHPCIAGTVVAYRILCFPLQVYGHCKTTCRGEVDLACARADTMQPKH